MRNTGGMRLFGVDNLLLNFLYILVAVLVYFSLGLYKKKSFKLIIGGFCSSAVVFCMTFPFTVFPGYIYDLRIVPFLISILYGGFTSGFIVSIVLLLFRYLIGGDGFEVTVVAYMPMFVLTILFLKIIRNLSNKIYIMYGTALALTSSLCVSISSLIMNDVDGEQYAWFFVYYCVLVTVCMWVCMYIIETTRENIRMRDEIQRSEKLHVLGELAATIAHEIRNPLTVAKGFIQLLVTRSRDDTDLRYSNIVLDEIDRAETIISDYLTYAKPEAGKIERIDVKVQLLNIINIMESYVISHGHVITYKLEESLFIDGEHKKISQAMVNLFKNAVEAMEESGAIKVTAYMDKNKNVVIEVSDTGVGMTSEQMSLLGNPFYSTKAKGTGLGLMVTYRIIEALHGEIRVTSERAKGTTFTVTIPSAS